VGILVLFEMIFFTLICYTLNNKYERPDSDGSYVVNEYRSSSLDDVR
jgi:hypothetical protein